MKTVGYIRVSTSEQVDNGISLDNQRHKIEAFAELKDLDLIEVISDEGCSGKNLKREGISRIISLIEHKEADAVIVYKLDRISRKTKDLLYLFEDVFNKHKTNFYSLNENIDTTTAQGKFFLTLMGAMAQMERDLISERTADALTELKRQSRRLGNPDKAPFGFKQTKRKKAMLADLKPIQKELDVIRNIYRMRARKHSLASIGEKHGMAKSTIKYLLDNPIYRELGVISFS